MYVYVVYIHVYTCICIFTMYTICTTYIIYICIYIHKGKLSNRITGWRLCLQTYNDEIFCWARKMLPDIEKFDQTIKGKYSIF